MIRVGVSVTAVLLLSISVAGQAQPSSSTGAAASASHCPAAHNPMYAGMSEAGCMAMLTATRGIDNRSSQAEVKAARDRVLAVLDAERLDPVALRRAMDDERAAVALQQTQQAKKQAAMLTGFEQLSLADRRAFVADARAIRERFEARVAAQQQEQKRGAAGVN